jgi:hypothetical protein
MGTGQAMDGAEEARTRVREAVERTLVVLQQRLNF